MIELIYIWKIIWIIFQEGWNMPNLENQRVLHFEFQCQKLSRLYHITFVLLFCRDLSTEPYRGLWFNRTHLPLFQNMSVKIYSDFFLSSGGYNFKIKNYLKDKMRYGMWVHILLNDLASSSLQHEYYFWHRKSKCYEKAVKFNVEIFEFKVFARSNN